MTRPARSISELLAPECYGGKAAWLSRLHAVGLRVPDAIVFPACNEATFESIKFDLIYAKATRTLLAPFCAADGTYEVAIRSSATIEAGAAESLAGHFETFLGRFSFDDVLARVCSVYRQGFGVLKNHEGMIAVIVQRMINASFAGVYFSANPLTSSRNAVAPVVRTVFGDF